MSDWQAIVLDCGDTMLALDPSRETILVDTLKSLGIDVTLDDAAMAYRLVDFAFKQKSSEQKKAGDRAAFYREFNRKLTIALGCESRLDELHDALGTAFRERRNWAPMQGTLDALHTLGAAYPLYVLANWDANLAKLLDEVGILDRFQKVHASADLGAEKPSPKIYAAFLDAEGLDPARCVYVGNEYEADVVGARAAGFTPILLDHPGFYRDGIDALYARTWHDVIALIESNAPR